MIKDSGERRQFYDKNGNEIGVRDIQVGKGEPSLMPLDVIAGFYKENYIYDVLNCINKFIGTGNPIWLERALEPFMREVFESFSTAWLEVSIHFEEGAIKYGRGNAYLGINTTSYINSALRHLFKYIRSDNDERHDRAFVWNLLMCIWTCEHKPELNDYKKEEHK